MKYRLLQRVSLAVHFVANFIAVISTLTLFVVGGLISYIKPLRRFGGWLQDKSGIL